MTIWFRPEAHPETITPPPPAAQQPGDLTHREATRPAKAHTSAIRGVVRRGPALASRNKALLTAAIAANATPAAVADRSPTSPAAPDGDPYAAGVGLSRAFTVGVLVVAAVVEFFFWWTSGRQSVRNNDYTSPAAIQAVALAMLFPTVVAAGAVLGTALGRLWVLPVGARRGWYQARSAIAVTVVVLMSAAMAFTAQARFGSENMAVGAKPLPVFPLAIAFFLVPLVALAVHAFAVHPDQQIRDRDARAGADAAAAERDRAAAPAAAHHRHAVAWLALQADVHQLLAEYQLRVSRAEADVLGLRARNGLAGTPAHLRRGVAPAAVGPQMWLDVPTPPALQPLLEPSLLLLRQYPPRILPRTEDLVTEDRPNGELPAGQDPR